MERSSRGIIENLYATATDFGRQPLLVSPNGSITDLAHGYIPLLGRFTFEDKAAKGLRKRKAEDKPEPPVYFSALELVRDYRILFLSGPSGSGKSTFAKYISFRMATTGVIKAHPVVRNDLGHVHDENWDPATTVVPCYFAIDGSESLRTLVDSTLPELLKSFSSTDGRAREMVLLIILDSVDKAGSKGPALIADTLAAVEDHENIKLLLLGETTATESWNLPPTIVRHNLLPLLQIHRRQAASELTRVALSDAKIGLGEVAALPAYFALALEALHAGNRAEDLVDAWLAVTCPEKDAAERLTAQAFNGLVADGSKQHTRANLPLLVGSSAVQQLLAARHLASQPLETAIALFHQEPTSSEQVIRSLLARLEVSGRSDGLVEGLIHGSGTDAQRGALLVSDFITRYENLSGRISSLMLAIMEEGSLPAIQRDRAGRVLSRLGDPRDLTSLASVPPGTFALGSQSHPNEQSLGEISLAAFRIGRYPVVNREYSSFIQETGRAWPSPDGLDPEKQNAPATNLTWYDAMAYCSWLTARWRASRSINQDEEVRLPTEPEWERASRGDRKIDDHGGLVYPWGIKWQDDAANCEESGFNTTCPVGTFPRGCSPYGCHDMAGHVWEWCTTLWGEDMATPSFLYPWRDDGREDMGASGSIRRVLRGGCFSSTRLKASCTYRGSLEPAGFWRGNGFRIVVAQVPL